MPYFAHVQDGTVLSIRRLEAIVVIDEHGNESEQIGQQFLSGLYPGTAPSEYVLTVYSPDGEVTPWFRGKYACIGDTWDGESFSSPAPSAE